MYCECGKWVTNEGRCRECLREKYAHELRTLSKSFREPVLPLSAVCDALIAWSGAIQENVARGNDRGPGYFHQGEEYAQHLTKMLIDVRKSGLLWRLLYCNQKLRTEMCPVHKGHMACGLWVLGGDECCDGSGWLEEKVEDREARRQAVLEAKAKHPQLWPAYKASADS